ncbi:LOW QUALITY PROTEIN: hypothetical protein ACHAW5_006787 [Stephanodiscus triporus]|uniref:ABC1 atypical kinase-like domain-containing protein n=1 Tax=Stephanodiscus triporus TaxID=2934178 RepID=A0ABD3PAH6_9STRA
MTTTTTTTTDVVEEKDAIASIVDVPPMPRDGFAGMDVTGEINGVKMTTSGRTMKRARARSGIDDEGNDDDDPVEVGENDNNNNGFADRDRERGRGLGGCHGDSGSERRRVDEVPVGAVADKSYVPLDSSSTATDGDGLPLTYDKDLIEAYWRKERGVEPAVVVLRREGRASLRGSARSTSVTCPDSAVRPGWTCVDLGPTFIKAGQMMSVRPDVLPQATLDELAKLQDSVVGFDTAVAVRQIEEELGGPLGEFFTSISEEPVAAASLAQVYLATLNDGMDTRVAVKVQRPNVLSTGPVSSLRRAAEVFQGLVERFAPQQRTNYVALLNEWAIGFYTELDFANEARNQMRPRAALIDAGITGITVPRVYEDMCTRRVLVSEWMDGKKLSECPAGGDRRADPHPGNILKLDIPTPEGHTVALLDCGLMATIDREDQDHMISAVIHLANKDYKSLVDDFIRLNILPTDCDRAAIIPLMDKALSPYVKGGGTKKYEEELKKLYGMEADNVSSQVGGFQAMTQDALTVLNDIPFSIPPYFSPYSSRS